LSQLRVFPVPTALPVARRDYPDAVFRSQEGMLRALLRNMLGRHENA
jgi:preprotein translocase subunit SecA